jgi:hypothetical protein
MKKFFTESNVIYGIESQLNILALGRRSSTGTAISGRSSTVSATMTPEWGHTRSGTSVAFDGKGVHLPRCSLR